MRAGEVRLVVLVGVGPVFAAGLVWLINNTRPPSPPVMAAAMLLVTSLVVAPWIVLAGRRFADDPAPTRVLRLPWPSARSGFLRGTDPRPPRS